MKARDLATPYPTVRIDSSAIEAARLLTEHGRPGLIVVDAHDHPVAILPGSQVLRFLIPGYIQSDRKLARALDESFADHICDPLVDKTVAELLPKERTPLPVVEPDDNLVEVAALMLTEHAPLVAVVDGPGKDAAIIGAIGVTRLLSGLLPEKVTGAS